MSAPVGIRFGDPRHPWKYSTEHATKAAKKGKRASPWSKRPMCPTGRAVKLFEQNAK